MRLENVTTCSIFKSVLKAIGLMSSVLTLLPFAAVTFRTPFMPRFRIRT